MDEMVAGETIANEAVADEPDVDELFGKLKGAVQFVIYVDESRRGAFRRGVNALCSGVHAHGSIKRAVEPLHMSESKARRALRETEEVLGFKIIDGAESRKSALTPEGEMLHEIYQQIQSEINIIANRRFQKLIKARTTKPQEDT